MSQFHSNIAPKPFTFTPATQADIPRLTHIHLVTLAEDPPAQIKFPSAENFAAAVSSMLEKQIGDPNWRIMKAVDEETGEIGSWASWLTHDASDSHPKPDPRPEEEGNGEDNNGKGEDEGNFNSYPASAPIS
ncbi:uncharacterized protein PAC_04480 [Phialocephala subalpina]|uniref:N-acetyltransferase domain-containing protein n=1 Tax=Phialocephala subalpina TaxID=576137 RepID=A0A1L7WPA4_9HELO|nr:uncharacterized protein PAC_04480 [Phialocephala subalpina]